MALVAMAAQQSIFILRSNWDVQMYIRVVMKVVVHQVAQYVLRQVGFWVFVTALVP